MSCIVMLVVATNPLSHVRRRGGNEAAVTDALSKSRWTQTTSSVLSINLVRPVGPNSSTWYRKQQSLASSPHQVIKEERSVVHRHARRGNETTVCRPHADRRPLDGDGAMETSSSSSSSSDSSSRLPQALVKSGSKGGRSHQNTDY